MVNMPRVVQKRSADNENIREMVQYILKGIS